MEKDECPRCGERLTPMSIFRVDFMRNWNNSKIKSAIICHTCLRDIEEYVKTKPHYNEHGYNCGARME